MASIDRGGLERAAFLSDPPRPRNSGIHAPNQLLERIAAVLITEADTSGDIWLSEREIAERSGCALSSACRGVQNLKRAQLVEIVSPRRARGEAAGTPGGSYPERLRLTVP
jgi:hypothetical protein